MDGPHRERASRKDGGDVPPHGLERTSVVTGLDVWATRRGDGEVQHYNLESATFVGSSQPRVLTVFQIGLQYVTTMDHHMKESFHHLLIIRWTDGITPIKNRAGAKNKSRLI